MKTFILNSQNLDQYNQHIWYRKQEGFRKAGLIYQYSQEEILEYAKCYNDPVYFFEKYCKLITPEGYGAVKLRDYQIELINHIRDNRFSITNHVRQSGITSIINLMILHSLVFKGSVIARFDYKKDVAISRMEQIKDMYRRLPFFLQPGVLQNDAAVFRLENGALLHAKFATSVAIGMNYNEYHLDGFGFYENNEKLFKSLVPTVAARKDGKMIITSTGGEFFDKLYIDAKNKLNNFAPFEVRWWQVYEKEDIENLKKMEGDNDSFKKQFLLK